MKSLPVIKKENNGYLFLVDNKPFIMLAGEVHNSACTSEKYMQYVWKKAEELNCNTILAPVYWELFEPQENEFDYNLIQNIILESRLHNTKLVLLWFGSWKNGLSSYVPQWVKKDLMRFPRTEDEYGTKTKILSMFNSEIFSSELNAYTHFLNYLYEFDSEEQTVIAVQIENEIGILGAERDFSKYATEAFNKCVPNELLEYFEEGFRQSILLQNIDNLVGTWKDIFGSRANEVFMAWNYASYVNGLAKAGKECYKIPSFTNVWLKEFDDEMPGLYPSGGPEPDMLDIWKCAAPDLDVLAPDIYTLQFEKIAKLYRRKDNPLFIPETRRDKWAVANLYISIGTYKTLCYSPFGIESVGENRSFITPIIHTNSSDKNVSNETVKDLLAKSYQIFRNAMPLITKFYATDKMIGFVQEEGQMAKHIKLGNFFIELEFYHAIEDDNNYIPGAGIVINMCEDELVFLGYGYRACVSTLNQGKQLDFLLLEKGTFDKNHNWKKYMYLNGDEQRIQMEEEPTALRAVFYEF